MPRLRKLYRSKEPLVLGVVSTALLLFAWEVFAREHWVDPAFSSQPTAIAQQFMNMYVRQRDIYFHLWISLEEAGLGFALALLVGVPTGMLLGRVRRVRYVAEPFIMAFYSTPTVALFPLLILWFGIGTMPKVLLIFLGGVFSILVNTQTGVENVDARLIETALAFRATEWQIFRKIMLPSATPYILAGIRLAVGRVLIMMFVGELVIANQGLGFIVADAGATFKAGRLFVGVLTLTAIGVVLTQLLRYLEQRKFTYVVQE